MLPGLAVALLTLIPGAVPAAAGINDYTTTLYLSGAPTTIPALAGSYQLVTSAGPGTPASAPTAASSGSVGVLSGTYQYEYTVVDGTGGETAVSAASPGITVASKTINVNGLPTGVTIRLYRTCSCSSALFYRVAQFTPTAAMPQFVDNNLDATTDVAANLLPLTQNRPVAGLVAGIGYYEFAPAVPLKLTTSVSTNLPSPTFSAKGWVVDAAGRVSIPSGMWTFTNKFKGTAGPVGTTGHLVVGVYVVDDTGAVVSTVIDPTGAGENMVANIATTAGTASTITTTINGVGALTLAANQHIYVQYWRRQTANQGNTTTTMWVYDGIASITHPAANAYPDVPALNSVAARVKTTPPLSATFSDPDAADTGTLSFELCSDPACATVLQSGSSAAGLANGATGTWTPPMNIADGLHDGTYYWRAQATDSYAGGTGPNVSGWSGTSSFVVDTVPPGTPTLDSPAAAARVNTTQLGATFVDSDAGDSGTVDFELCSNASCSAVVSSSTSSTVGPGAAVSWTPTGLADGTYYWRLRATDVAGNQTASWTPTQSFVLDTNPPGVPSLTSPADASYLGAAPALKGTFTSGDVGDSGKLDFQVCTDSGCTSVAASGSSSSGLGNGATGSWTPSGLADGGYFWRSRAQDAAGNQSAWSSRPQLHARHDGADRAGACIGHGARADAAAAELDLRRPGRDGQRHAVVPGLLEQRLHGGRPEPHGKRPREQHDRQLDAEQPGGRALLLHRHRHRHGRERVIVVRQLHRGHRGAGKARARLAGQRRALQHRAVERDVH